jgi:carbonic anhydrase
MGKFDRYAFSAQPSFNEAATREAFSRAVPLKTLVIYCYDPRAAEIPDAVAKLFGDEVFPGEIILDGAGNRVASSTTIFPVIVAGGRAIDALRSITVAQHLFGIQNIVAVHHSHCGATSFTADGIIDAYEQEHYLGPLPAKQHLHHRLRGFAQARHRPDPLACRHARACEYFRLFL